MYTLYLLALGNDENSVSKKKDCKVIIHCVIESNSRKASGMIIIYAHDCESGIVLLPVLLLFPTVASKTK